MLPVRVSRRSVAIATLAGLAVLAGLFFWWRARRSFLDRWGDDALGLVSPARIGTEIDALSVKPHRSGTPANAAVADEVAAAALVRLAQDLDRRPRRGPLGASSCCASRSRGREATRSTSTRGRCPPTRRRRAAKEELPFLAYSPDADLEAPLVYANFGAAEDYETLRKAGVDPRGKVAIVHAQGVCRGEKVAAAESAGVAALLVYIEPKDQGIVKPAYPEGSGPYPAAAVPRFAPEVLPPSRGPEACEGAGRRRPAEGPRPRDLG